MKGSMIREWSSFEDSQLVVESVANANGGKDCYMKGIFIQADQRNLNERVYPLHEISNAVRGMNSRIGNGNSILGECDHPDTLTVNLDRVSHIITEMNMNGTNGIGTLKMLPTPHGKLIQTMLENGVKLGVSSRGSGNVDHSGHVSDFDIVTVDVVAQPSAPDAYPTAVFESLYKTSGYAIMEDTAKAALQGSKMAESEIWDQMNYTATQNEWETFYNILRNNQK
ncbi:prohead core protein serine protease [Vibrio phage 2.275.O._10N.286.54.E11]|nr:prohead core protein serine protease [Vibrio phage 2.275.O._10N.286.54.E11]